MTPIKDYPKLKSPYIRTDINGKHVCTPEIEPGYEWLFDPGVCAVDKLHGTNICVHIQGGHIEAIDNRDTRVIQSCFLPTKGNGSKFLIGVLNACDKGWLSEDGSHYGELIGPTINDNIHQAPTYLFVPFDHLRKKYHWHSWVQNKYPKDFNSISEWFKTLPSLFTQRVLGKEVMAEGLVFYHPDGRKCKLRRDMFDWYDGKGHKEKLLRNENGL
jgi:hypothetical protein